MRRILLFAVAFLIGYAWPRETLKAQDSTISVHEGLTLDMHDVIDALSDYDVRHIDVPINLDWYGMTHPDLKTIFIVNQMDLAQRRRTVVHELVHVAMRLHGNADYTDENVVSVVTELEYKKLYH